MFKKKNKYLFIWLIFLPFIILRNTFLAMFLQIFIDNVSKFTSLNNVVMGILLVTFSFTLLMIGQMVCAYFKHLYIQNKVLDLRQNYIKEHLIHYHLQNITSSLLNDMDIIEKNYLESKLELIQESILFLISLVIIFTYSKLLAIYFVVVACLFMIISQLGSKKFNQFINHESIIFKDYISIIKDAVNGQIVLKMNQASRYIINCLKVNLSALKSNQIKMTVYKEMIANLSMLILVITMVFFKIYGIYLVSQEKLTLGALMAISQISNGIINPLSNIPVLSTTFKAAKPLYQKIKQSSDSEFYSTNEVIHFDHLEIKNLNLELAHGVLFQDYSLSIHQDDKILILGKNGSGKSTLLKAILSIREDIKVNYVLNHQSMPYVPSQLFSYVSQTPFLFDDTVLFNITLHENVNRDKLETILELVGLDTKDEFLLSKVGMNGELLSSGQKQKIAIARALYIHRPILVLDEPFSNIDAFYKDKICSYLLNQSEQTIILVEHYLKENLINQFTQIVNIG